MKRWILMGLLAGLLPALGCGCGGGGGGDEHHYTITATGGSGGRGGEGAAGGHGGGVQVIVGDHIPGESVKNN